MADRDKALVGKLASHIRWGNTADRTAATEPMRRAFREQFVDKARELHPDATEDQILAAAESLRKAHYARMARRSAEVRRRPKPEVDHRARAEAARAALDAAKAGR